ncbi:MAG: hypothetical protein KIT54_09535 [Phycisphaeraceae bacterium]|nr:hypothetical protein [Phycisphaeraceae bacterium]
MHRCLLNPALERVRVNGFAFPLGVYPVEPVAPTSGYTVDFEPADGDEEWEEWPDRYVYEVLVSAERLRPLCSALLSLLPGRVYPILDVLGNDAFREIDPYIAYELVGVEALYDGMRWYEPFLFEDGLCGFGAMSEEPFFYFFLDEHKVLTIRVETEHKERVDRLLTAFELLNLGGEPAAGNRARRADGQPPVEVLAADAVSHEHRSVLLTPDDRPELPGPEEVTEALVDLWGMTLNIDVERNLDDDGRELGTTGWRCLVRVDPAEVDPAEVDPADADGPQSTGSTPESEGKPATDDQTRAMGTKALRTRYVEVVLAASCWREAEDLALTAASQLPGGPKGVSLSDEHGPRLVSADRLRRHELASIMGMLAAADGSRAGFGADAAGAVGGVGVVGGVGGVGGRPVAAETHGPRAKDGSTPPPAPADSFEDDQPPEPPEVAALLDEVLASGAAGRILAARWLE